MTQQTEDRVEGLSAENRSLIERVLGRVFALSFDLGPKAATTLYAKELDQALNAARSDAIARTGVDPVEPVAWLEPRGCPLPGACACPAPMTPEQRAAIICDFMGWTQEGPAWTDAHKLAASLSGGTAPSKRTLVAIDAALPAPVERGEIKEIIAEIIREKVSAPMFMESHMEWAHENDIEIAASAILAALASGGE